MVQSPGAFNRGHGRSILEPFQQKQKSLGHRRPNEEPHLTLSKERKTHKDLKLAWGLQLIHHCPRQKVRPYKSQVQKKGKEESGILCWLFPSVSLLWCGTGWGVLCTHTRGKSDDVYNIRGEQIAKVLWWNHDLSLKTLLGKERMREGKKQRETWSCILGFDLAKFFEVQPLQNTRQQKDFSSSKCCFFCANMIFLV